MMTRKHFEAIAHTLNSNVADLNLVEDFADMCEESNPNFNRAQFVAASTKALRVNVAYDAARLGIRTEV